MKKLFTTLLSLLLLVSVVKAQEVTFNQRESQLFAEWLAGQDKFDAAETTRLADKYKIPRTVGTGENQAMLYRIYSDEARAYEVPPPAFVFNHMTKEKAVPPKEKYLLPVYIGPNNTFVMPRNDNAAKTTRANRVWPGGPAGLNLTGKGVVIAMWDGDHVDGTHSQLAGRITPVGLGANPSDKNHPTHVAGTMIAKGLNLTTNTPDPSKQGMAYEATIRSYYYNNPLSQIASEAAIGTMLSNHSYGLHCGWAFMKDYKNIPGVNPWFLSTYNTAESDLFGMYSSTDNTIDTIARLNPFHLIIRSAGNDRLEGPPSGSFFQHFFYNTSTSQVFLTNTPRNKDGVQPDGSLPPSSNGYDSIPYGTTSKNVLCVGAVDDVLNYTGPGSVTLAPFSSCGPTDDGRIKPDVVGNGVNVSSTMPGNAYGPKGVAPQPDGMSGTSMASPNVTGTAALLLQQWMAHYVPSNPKKPWLGTQILTSKPVSSVFLKALLIHTADEAGANLGPDYQFGWGLVNAERAANFARHRLETGAVGMYGAEYCNNFQEKPLVNGTMDTLVLPCCTPGQPIKVTLVWHDPAGIPQTLGIIDPPNYKALINDLDLEVVGPGGTPIHYPWVLNKANPTLAATKPSTGNHVDNVEQVFIPTGVAGNYTIHVKHTGPLLSGQPQPYALLWDNLKTGGLPIKIPGLGLSSIPPKP
jgi:subtilisin family serine protease